jgi:predicted protein tyrosine phosphatase
MQQSEKAVADDGGSLAKDGAVHVCPLSAVPDIVARSNASHLLTCLQDAVLVETPSPILPDRHLRLHIHDIAEPMMGCIAPGEEHVGQLIDFALDWGGRGPMVVHCWAGISRSTAAAYTVLCDRAGPGAEREIADDLRARAPHAQPNRLIVRLADEALGRGGAMVRAIDAIGAGTMVTEGAVVDIPLHPTLP